MFLLFGLLLIYTAVQLFRHRDEDPDVEDNAWSSATRRLLPVTDEYVGGKLVTRVDGRRMVTPLFIVLIAIGSIDLLFALDSIPAVFGVTEEPYIVFAANAFALLGLRALFFLVKGLLDRLVYLSTGLALILAFIGVKLILHWAHVDIDPRSRRSPPRSRLAVIIVVLVVVTVASLIRVRAHPGGTRPRRVRVQPSRPARREAAGGRAGALTAGALTADHRLPHDGQPAATMQIQRAATSYSSSTITTRPAGVLQQGGCGGGAISAAAVHPDRRPGCPRGGLELVQGDVHRTVDVGPARYSLVVRTSRTTLLRQVPGGGVPAAGAPARSRRWRWAVSRSWSRVGRECRRCRSRRRPGGRCPPAPVPAGRRRAARRSRRAG